MRLIDADALVKRIYEDGKSSNNPSLMMLVGFVTGYVNKQQEAIVRCKDCKHGSIYMTEDVCGETLIECNRPDLGDVIEIHGWKWFCADGERREE